MGRRAIALAGREFRVNPMGRVDTKRIGANGYHSEGTGRKWSEKYCHRPREDLGKSK
jgi:hypothetical protein